MKRQLNVQVSKITLILSFHSGIPLYLVSIIASSITLTPVPVHTGPYCPNEVIIFTCIGIAIPYILNWKINNSIIAYYNFKSTHDFPYNFTIINSNINVVAINATSANIIQGCNCQNMTSILQGVASNMRGSSIRCTSPNVESGSFNIKIQGNVFTLSHSWVLSHHMKFYYIMALAQP